MNPRRALKAALLAVALSTPSCGPAPRPETARPVPPPPIENDDDAALRSRLDALVAASHAELGVAYREFGQSRSFSHRGDRPFPMASVYKLPIALSVMARIDAGELDPTTPVQVEAGDLAPGHSPLADNFPEAGRSLEISELLESALVSSDNTASDVLLRLAGGPSAVSAYLQRLGLGGMRVDRSETQMAADILQQLRPGLAPFTASRGTLSELEASLSGAERERAVAVVAGERRDTTTPDAALALLEAFVAGRALSPEKTAVSRSLLERAKPDRLRLGLPKSVTFAHKTGTSWGAFNDIGIATLPDRRQLLIAVFVKSARGLSMDAGNALVAEIGRALYEDSTAATRRAAPD